jgi:hypothetical protein
MDYSSQFAQKQDSTRSILLKTILRSDNLNHGNIKHILLHSILELALDCNTAALRELQVFRYRIDSTYYRRPDNAYQSMLRNLNNSGGWRSILSLVRHSLILIRTTCIRFLPASNHSDFVVKELKELDSITSEVENESQRVLDFVRQEHEIHNSQNLLSLARVTLLFTLFSTFATIACIPDSQRVIVFIVLAFVISAGYSLGIRLIAHVMDALRYIRRMIGDYENWVLLSCKIWRLIGKSISHDVEGPKVDLQGKFAHLHITRFIGVFAYNISIMLI